MGLGVILSLKELDLSLQEIKSLLSSNVQYSREVLKKKKKEISSKIVQLNDIKAIIDQKLHFFELAEKQINQISFIELQAEYLLLSKKFEGNDAETEIEIGYELFIDKGKYIFSNNEYGAMFQHDHREPDAYDYFYLKTDKEDEYDYIKPAGTYLRYVHKGNDTSLQDAYSEIREFISERNLKLEGYFYERAFNETIHSNIEEYITEIQVKIKSQ